MLGAAGLLSKMPSICSITSGVSFSASLTALTLSSIWCVLVAPRITWTNQICFIMGKSVREWLELTVLTLGFLMHHARLSWPTLPPSFSASSVNCTKVREDFSEKRKTNR